MSAVAVVVVVVVVFVDVVVDNNKRGFVDTKQELDIRSAKSGGMFREKFLRKKFYSCGENKNNLDLSILIMFYRRGEQNLYHPNYELTLVEPKLEPLFAMTLIDSSFPFSPLSSPLT